MRDSARNERRKRKTKTESQTAAVQCSAVANTAEANGLLLTFAGAFVRLQLHEVRTSAREGLVEVDEAEVGARAAAVHLSARVRCCRREKRE